MVTEDPKLWEHRRRIHYIQIQAALLAVFTHFGKPLSFLDVGCGLGYTVRMAALLGIPSVGVDIMLKDPPITFQNGMLAHADLQKPLAILGTKFEYVWCTEVAEHLPEESADGLVASLCFNAINRIIFTAAPPGQKGAGHVNLKSQVWWCGKFEKRGWDFNAEDTISIRQLWDSVCGRARWYPNNVQIFTKR